MIILASKFSIRFQKASISIKKKEILSWLTELMKEVFQLVDCPYLQQKIESVLQKLKAPYRYNAESWNSDIDKYPTDIWTTTY